MVRIWGKLIKDEKILKDYLLEKDEKFSIVSFLDYVEDMCYNLDIPQPVVLKYHIKNYFTFNNAKFKAGDFVEHINFDEFVLENAVID